MPSKVTTPPDIPSIISQLTLPEKVQLLAGRDFWTTNPIDRLGVPSLKVSDGPNGARGAAFHGGVTSACFPAAVSLAASFDRLQARNVGAALAEETRSKGANVLLGPTACCHRDPRGGRNFESFSEDPFLAGELASEYILGLQENGVGATIKHFVANESETKRFTIDVRVSPRALREVYLKPFEIAIKKADPWAVMTSYNLVNGVHTDSDKNLLDGILRKEWGFKGLVMSDWGGVNSTAQGLNAGHDLEMPGPARWRTLEKINAAIDKGELTEATIDQRVEKVLEYLVRTGKYDDPTTPDEVANDKAEHRQLIRRAGADGVVLLKNRNNALPLKRDSLKSVAVIGLAKQFLGHGGGSAAVNAHHKITAYDALEEALGDQVELKYAEGVSIIRNFAPMAEHVVDEQGSPGFTCRIQTKFGTTEVKNIPNAMFSALERGDIDSVSIHGTFTPQQSGNHHFSFGCFGQTKVFIDDEPLFSIEGAMTDDIVGLLLGAQAGIRKPYRFEAGRSYAIRIESQALSGAKYSDLAILSHDLVTFNLGFVLEQEFAADRKAVAVEAASSSEVAIVFTGHTPVWETEGMDRQSMDLPADGSQDELVRSVAAVNKNTIVVNSTGSPVTMPWMEDVAAIVQAWFPGQEAGHSVVDILLGKVNPSGKLPVTFPKAIQDAPSWGNFPCTGDLKDLREEYVEDVFVGYKHYDRPSVTKPLFPFGYGLSYTSFEIGDVKLSKSKVSTSDTVTISLTVSNTGAIVGSETVQIYVGPKGPQNGVVERPHKTLAGFAKVRDLQPRQTSKTSVEVCVQESFSYWDEERHGWVVPKETYVVYVATSSAESDVVAKIEVEVVEGSEVRLVSKLA